MSKKAFVEEYSKATGETKKRSEELVKAFLDTVESLVLSGEDVQFVGWGSFKLTERDEREGVNLKLVKKLKYLQRKF